MSSSASYFLPAPSGGVTASGVSASQLKVRRWIDATTRDYVIEGGEVKQDYGFTSKVVLALGMRLGSCQVLPTFGSRLHEIRSANEQGRRLAEAYALLALQHLTDEIQDLTVTATISAGSPGRIDLVVSGRRGMTVLSATYTASL